MTFAENLSTASGLSILINGVISLSDATSYDKRKYKPDVLVKIISYINLYGVNHLLIHKKMNTKC